MTLSDTSNPIDKSLGRAAVGIVEAVEGAELAAAPRAIDRSKWTEEGHAVELDMAAFSRNDMGNAQRLMTRFGDALFHVPGVGWHGWDGNRWNFDRGFELASRAAHYTAASILTEAEALVRAGAWYGESDKQFEDRVDAHRRWGSSSGNVARIAAMLTVAQQYLSRRIEEIDAKPFLFNVENGTLELGQPDADRAIEIKLRPPDRHDLITRLAPVTYDPKAECPEFGKFLSRSQPVPELRTFLQTWLGYAVTGSVEEQCLVLWHGKGANGKGKLVDAMLRLFGDYATTIPFATLLHDDRRRGSEATPDTAQLPGVRLVVAAEPEVGARFSESMLKTLTGEDQISARHLREAFFRFQPQFKITLSFNNAPTIRGTDEGIWRRLHLVPWRVVIPKEERDRRLSEKLRAELPGILNWVLRGYILWRERGLEVPDAVSAATAEFRGENDPIGRFLDAAVEPSPDGRIQAAVLYGSYEKWCKAEGLEPRSSTMFGKILREKDYRKETVGKVFYVGLSMRPGRPWMDEDEPRRATKEHAS